MKTLAALVFPGFQTLDLYGPIEMLGDHDAGSVDIKIVAETSDPVPSYHGTRTTVDRTLAGPQERRATGAGARLRQLRQGSQA